MNKLEIAAQILASMTSSEKYQLATVNFKVRDNGALVPPNEAKSGVQGVLERHAHLALHQAEALMTAFQEQTQFESAQTVKAKATGNILPTKPGSPHGWMR